jgi:hypothetical protein
MDLYTVGFRLRTGYYDESAEVCTCAHVCVCVCMYICVCMCVKVDRCKDPISMCHVEGESSGSDSRLACETH